MSNDGFAVLGLFYKTTKYLTSTFDIRYSLFDICFLQFLLSIKLVAPRPEVSLTPETF